MPRHPSSRPRFRLSQIHEGFALFDEAPRLDVNRGHAPSDRRLDRHLHFHGFEHGDRLALFDFVVEINFDLPDGTSYMSTNCGGHGAFKLSCD